MLQETETVDSRSEDVWRLWMCFRRLSKTVDVLQMWLKGHVSGDSQRLWTSYRRWSEMMDLFHLWMETRDMLQETATVDILREIFRDCGHNLGDFRDYCCASGVAGDQGHTAGDRLWTSFRRWSDCGCAPCVAGDKGQ